jgi:hypothetical protein
MIGWPMVPGLVRTVPVIVRGVGPGDLRALRVARR